MTEELSIFSTLEDIRICSDEVLVSCINAVARDVIVAYILELRKRLKQAELDIYQKDVLLNSASLAMVNNTSHINSNTSASAERLHMLSLSSAPPQPTTIRPDTSAIPKKPDGVIRETITLEKGWNGLGLSISGGKDTPHYPNDSRIYITKIIPNSVSDLDSRLRVNDCLVKVMDKALDNVSHEEAVDILRNSPPRVTLTIERIRNTEKLVQRVVTLNRGEEGFGISIAGGKGTQHILGSDGIYITEIIPGGAADNGILQIGDRILSVHVNNINIAEVTHDVAVDALKGAGDNVMLVIARNIPEVFPDNTDSIAAPSTPPVADTFSNLSIVPSAPPPSYPGATSSTPYPTE